MEFLFSENTEGFNLKNKVLIISSGDSDSVFSRELYSFFNNTKEHDYILKTELKEKKENRIVKKNQVAEKVDYTLEVTYDLYYKTSGCRVLSKNIITSFSTTPKSSGYNFGANRSFDRLYLSSVRKNIQVFINGVTPETTCLK